MRDDGRTAGSRRASSDSPEIQVPGRSECTESLGAYKKDCGTLNLSSPGEVVSERHDDHIESFTPTERIFPSLGKIGASPCACVPNAPVDDVDWSGGNDGRV